MTDARREAQEKIRPFSLYRDLGAVADLVAVAFGDELEPAGQAVLSDMRRAARWGLVPWLYGPGWGGGGVTLGFVWVEGKRVVGNVSLRRVLRWGGFLIGNVAVHPDWQGRGIGEALIAEAVEEASAQGGRWVGLEVRAGNEIARRLYERAGFREIGRTLHMLRPAGLPRIKDAAVHPALRRARGRDGEALVALMRAAVPQHLRPLMELREEDYRPGWGRAFDMWMLGRREVWWLAEEEGVLCGAVRAIHERSLRRPDQLEALVAPEYDGCFESVLVRQGLTSLRGSSGKMVEAILARPTEPLIQAFEEAGFRKLRELVQMRLDLTRSSGPSAGLD